MNRMFLYSVIMAFCLVTGSALWALENDVKEFPACKYCGMNRETFGHSRMLVEYDDGTRVGVCSLHCAAIDLAINMGMRPTAILVADYDTKQLMDAGNAVWVLGGKKQGVMTRRAKWAFKDKTAAEAFIKENEGVLTSFDDAMKASYEDMSEDTKMIREKKARAKMGGHGHGDAAQKMNQ
jgi:copper chaperone NosL